MSLAPIQRPNVPVDPVSATALITEIPAIDLGPLQDGTEASRRQVAAKLGDACERVGFLYLLNHGVPQELIDGVFKASADFFTLPLEKKLEIDIGDSTNYRGFVPMKAAGGTAKGNLKECFQIQPELPDSDPDVLAGKPLHGANLWPEGMPEFQKALTDYFDAVAKLADRMIPLFALALGLDEALFKSYFSKPISQLRLLCYEPQSSDMTTIGSQPHTDTGAFTILAQDNAGGLEVANGAGDWARATPIPGSFVVNLGEMMRLWSDGKFRATPHRVVNAAPYQRYSIPFFVNPDFDTLVEPLISCDLPADTPVFHTSWPRGSKVKSGDAFLRIYDYLWPPHKRAAE